jgi:ubiquinone/menaquinone biosynthesis C-methylase UbiE
MAIVRVLGFVGLYQVDNEYLKPVNRKLEEIEEDFHVVARVSNYSSQVVDALNSDDKSPAVNVALEFCTIDDGAKELKEIQRRIKEEETIDAAVTAANSPVLVKEIVEATMKEVTNHYHKVTELIPNIGALIREIGKKIEMLKEAATDWSLAKRIGTADALRSTGKRVKQVKNSAEEAQMKLQALKKSLEQIEI